MKLVSICWTDKAMGEGTQRLFERFDKARRFGQAMWQTYGIQLRVNPGVLS